jgi:RecB family exonuclease
LIEAAQSGWDHERTLRVLKLAPWAGVTGAMDRFEFDVRKRLPGKGLEGLWEIAGEKKILLALLEKIKVLEGWRGLSLPPGAWAMKVKELCGLAAPRQAPEWNLNIPLEFINSKMRGIEAWRAQAAALRGFEEAWEEAAGLLEEGTRIPFARFWQAASAAIRVNPLRVEDGRRDVVHVLGAKEARQWSLPVVFVCGLVQGQFPQASRQDDFFPDPARRALRSSGIALRTSEDNEMEEQFLFDAALGRARTRTVLSYPETDARGERNPLSLFLEPLGLPAALAQPVRPATEAGPPPSLSAALTSADLLAAIAERHGAVRPSALESFLQCPFQFFARYSLRLERPPARPEDRLDARVQGTLVHQALAEWKRAPQPIAPLFAALFEQMCAQEGIRPGYRTEALRRQMLADLERAVEDTQWPPGMRSETEKDLDVAVGPLRAVAGPLRVVVGPLRVKARLDRVETSADGRAYVIDYKYSLKSKEYLKDENALQGPLYLLALEASGQKPAGMFYCSLREQVRYVGWSDGGAGVSSLPLEREWLERAAARSARAAEEIAQGRIEVKPADLDRCRYCDFRDVCRYG